MPQDLLKQQVAQKAIEYVTEGMYVGIGTGTTANYFIDYLADIRFKVEGCVASSDASAQRLKSHGIPVLELSEVYELDIYVDGADEADPQLNLIKGGGAALTREKIVASNAKRFICIADESKKVSVLGAFPLPIEVIPLARSTVARTIIKLTGGEPVWRQDVITDNGNQIIDVHMLSITDPLQLESQINQIPGVVCNGIFAQYKADVLLLGTAQGVEVYETV